MIYLSNIPVHSIQRGNYVALVISIICVCFSSYGQIRNNDYKMMIDSAIIMQKEAYKKDVYLIDEMNQPYVPFSEILRKKFKCISLFAKSNKNQIKKGINAWKITSTLRGNRLIISIIDFSVTYKENNYDFGNNGGATVVFEYSCEEEKWLLKDSKWSGI